MEIVEATIHHLLKEAGVSGVGTVTTHLRQDNLPVNETLTTVSNDLVALYNRSRDSQGTFGTDPDVHRFPIRFAEYLADQIDFAALTEAAIALIAAQMEAARLSNGGYALFVRYQEGPNDFLLIAMLKLKAGAGIDDQLELLPTLNIDLSLLNEAARINISRLETLTEPYLTFIKGSRSKSEITEYFRTALACTNFTKSAAQTGQLIDAADAFVAQRQDLTNEQERQHERMRMRARLHDCLRQNSDEIALATAAANISPQDPQAFIDFVQTVVEGERRFNFNDQFKPDKTTVRTLKRIEGVMGSVRVSFDVDDVQRGAVSYDVRQNAVIIANPSETLRRSIQEYAPGPAD